jgi:hypothetical protein
VPGATGRFYSWAGPLEDVIIESIVTLHHPSLLKCGRHDAFDRALMAPRIRPGILLVFIAVLIAAIGLHATAQAEDLFDHGMTIAAPTRTGGSGVAARTPEAQSGQPNPNQAYPPETPDVTVTAARAPTDAELAGDSLSQFIVHHATVHYFNPGVTGSLANWRGGKRSICPLTKGLSPEQDDYVTARIRALAAYVGAPVQPRPQCEYNVTILFTNNPQAEMDEVFKWATVYFRNRYAGGTRDLIRFTSGHAIQGWYLMGGGLNNDLELAHLDVWPIWPQITQHYAAIGPTGTHFGGGRTSGIGAVILVVDTTKVVGYRIGAIADYLAVLSLSVAQSPDHCDLLPSILDLTSSSCGAREMPSGITAGDLAFLKALYYKSTGLYGTLTRSQIQNNMVRQFDGH